MYVHYYFRGERTVSADKLSLFFKLRYHVTYLMETRVYFYKIFVWIARVLQA